MLGAWLGGCVLMAFIYVRSLEAAGVVLNAPAAPVANIAKKLGYDETAELVRHVAAQEVRNIRDSWELGQILLAFVLAGCLFVSTQRRVFPLVLVGMMLVMVAFQHFTVSPELAYRGRDVDFPPDSTNVGLVTRVWALRQVYFGVEIVKLLAGGLLASYLFVYRAQRRVHKEAHALKEAE